MQTMNWHSARLAPDLLGLVTAVAILTISGIVQALGDGRRHSPLTALPSTE